MRIVMFYHSLISDWNHGNAHFLRGIAAELLARGHDVRIFEPENGWSLSNLLADYGPETVAGFRAAFPNLRSTLYDPARLDLDRTLDGADLVLVHEWNDPELVRRIGEHRRRRGRYLLLFHDTHHRAVTEREALARFPLADFDGVLAFGNVIRDLYLERGWAARAWTWHEAADTRVFRPLEALQSGSSPREPKGDLEEPKGDLVWIGNWGDDERTAELDEFLIRPVRELRLRACVYGVRYPLQARAALERAGIEYRGWVPNYRVPRIFASFRMTIHIPRRPYVRALPGVPTIRVFEALACGIPLLSAPWDDREHLFTPGRDFLTARDGSEMTRQLSALLRDPEMARALAAHGRNTILARHTCWHRVDQLMQICTGLTSDSSIEVAA